ncbi:condensation domain-containing protein, partial [Streptomyces sp. NPDC006971]|uniref:condensation domain-containing protein n=1 Tax=Streptomyces sp. NPDC006971 TaxID=3154784 RepID=UPI0034028BA7
MSVEKQKKTDVDALQEKLLRHRLGGGRSRARRRGIALADRSGPLRLSFGQQQMWFLNRLDPDSAEYLVPLAFRIRGTLDVAVLERAWNMLLARHEILRTRYTLTDGEPAQIIDPPRTVGLPVDEQRDVPGGERGRRADARVAEDARTPFDLEREWPVRARLLKLADDDHVLGVVVHHIAFDAWSARVLITELGALYEALAAGREAPLPELPVQYADYAAWQRAQEADGALAEHLTYWRERLAGIGPLDLPADRPRPAHRDHEGADVSFVLPDGLSEKIHKLALRHNTTPFAVLLPAFQALLARYTDRSDIAVGTVASGRTRPELQGLIGYGINNLVMRGSWRGDPRFAELIEQARDHLVEAYDHQSVPFARLVDELQPERDMSRTPLYQVAFTLHERGGERVELPGLTIEPHAATGSVAKCDLELQINSAPDGTFHGQLVYATSLFERDTVLRMSRHFVRLLQQAVEDETTPLSRLDVLDAAERALVTAGPRFSRPVTRTVHELFEEQVARTPDAVAVVAGEVSLSYAEVNARANRLARRLRASGVGAESLVGVCLERGPDLIPALLGVLKSGAGYVPLDTAHPAERLGHVLADAGVRIVVTTTGQEELLGQVFEGESVVLDREDLSGFGSGDPVSVSGPGHAVYVIYTSGS